MLGSWVTTGYRIRGRRPTRLRAARGVFAAVATGVLLFVASDPPASAQTAPPRSQEKVLRVSVADGLALAMPAIAQNYERRSGVKLIVTSGSSEKQVARIEAGDPADLFLGADFTFPEKLVADGLTDAKAPVAFAKNSLVLFARKDSPLQPISLETLQDSRLQSLAIADELRTPTGRASAAALTRLKVIDRLRPKLIQTEDVTDTAESVTTGKAQIALLPLTLAKSTAYQKIGTYILIPESQYPELRQYAVILQKGNMSGAHQFLNWLLSSEIQSKLPNIGLEAVR